MKIDGINRPNPHANHVVKLHPNKDGNGNKIAKVQDEQDDEVLAIEVETEENDEAKGVLCLLQEGHFKGVADIRLRINFHEELAAMQDQQLRQVASEQAGFVTDAVRQAAEEFVPTDDLTQEQFDQALTGFETTAGQFQDNFANDSSFTKDDLMAGLSSSFQAFLVAISPAPAQPAVEPPVAAAPAAEGGPAEPVVPVEGEATEPTEPPVEGEPTEPIVVPVAEPPAEPVVAAESDPFADFVSGLTTAFEESLESLRGSLSGVSVLPELSPPSGNGKAYDKFMAIYQNLNS